MIKIKTGVKFLHTSFMWPDVMRIIYIVQKMAPEGYEVTVTSAADGEHNPKSAHYKGRAIDFRIRDFPKDKSLETWKNRVQAALGSCYFVLLEKTHLHVQYNGV